MKICELEIRDLDSVSEITKALINNRYSVKTYAKFKEWPREGDIDCYVVEIYLTGK